MKRPNARVSWPGPAGGRGTGDDAVRRGLDGAAAGWKLSRLDGPADRGRIDRFHGSADRHGAAPYEGPVRHPQQGQRAPGHGRGRDPRNRGRARCKRRVPRSGLDSRRRVAGRQHGTRAHPALPALRHQATDRLQDHHYAQRPIGQPGAGWNGDQPRWVAALRGSRQSQRRRPCRSRPQGAGGRDPCSGSSSFTD